VVPDTLEWTLETFRSGKLWDMIERAGYPGVAANYNQRIVDEIFPELAKRARDMQAQPLPEKPAPNLVPH